nr:hypothetical protein CFP56_47003 [Quercus suber]
MDSAVAAVVEHLIDNVLSVVATEASLLWGVRDAIGDIKHELTSMRSLLIDADKRGSRVASNKSKHGPLFLFLPLTSILQVPTYMIGRRGA